MSNITEVTAEIVKVYGELFEDDYTAYHASAGRRFDRVFSYDPRRGPVRGGGRTVVLFVERATGDIYKSAGWSAPADIARFSAPTPEAARRVIENKADRHGSWLYLR